MHPIVSQHYEEELASFALSGRVACIQKNLVTYNHSR